MRILESPLSVLKSKIQRRHVLVILILINTHQKIIRKFILSKAAKKDSTQIQLAPMFDLCNVSNF